jgi:hypothetical protein
MLLDVELGARRTLFGHARFQQVDDAHLRLTWRIAAGDCDDQQYRRSR